MATHSRPVFESLRGGPLEISSIFRERADKYMVLQKLAQEVLREPSHLTPTDREVIAAFTSKLNGCEYCCGSHTEFARSLGASSDDVRMIDTVDTTTHRLSPILAYVRKLTLAPSTISNDDKQAVLAAGFTEEELKDAIGVCAAFNLFNRLVEGHGIPPKSDYSQDAEMLNRHGYDRRYPAR